MTLPLNLRDELLSAFLDGELTADEQSRVEQLLERDADARRHLERLKMLRESLRSGAKGPQIQLPPDFAARIVQAAFNEAAKSGLPPTHPLALAAARSSERETSPAEEGFWNWGWSRRRRLMGAVSAALAASVLLVVYLRGGPDQPVGHSGNGGLASHAPAIASERDPTATPLPEKISDDSGTEKTLVPDAVRPDRIAANTPSGDDSTVNPESPMKSDPPGSISPDSPAPDRVADSNPLAKPTEPMPPQQFPFLLMVEVRLKSMDVDFASVTRALEKAGISTPPKDVPVQGDILDKLASARVVQKEAPDQTFDSGDVQLVVIEAPCKRLDQFVIELMAGGGDVAQVGMHLTQDVAALSATRHFTGAHPREIRHADDSAVVQRLVGAGDQAGRWFKGAEKGVRFARMTASGPPMSFGSLGQQGADVPGTILLMVRSAE